MPSPARPTRLLLVLALVPLVLMTVAGALMAMRLVELEALSRDRAQSHQIIDAARRLEAGLAPGGDTREARAAVAALAAQGVAVPSAERALSTGTATSQRAAEAELAGLLDRAGEHRASLVDRTARRLSEGHWQAFAMVALGGGLVLALLIGYQAHKLRATARALRDLQDFERLKSEFVANVNHDLRTPLAAIKGATTILAGQELDAGSQRFVAMIAQNAERLHRAVQELLDRVQLERAPSGDGQGEEEGRARVVVARR